MRKYIGWFNSVKTIATEFKSDELYNKNYEAVDRAILEDLKNAEHIFAAYNQESYEGDALVIWKKSGKIFENHGSHCSCFGLEGQWDPEKVTKKALKHRLKEGYGILKEFEKDIIKIFKL